MLPVAERVRGVDKKGIVILTKSVVLEGQRYNFNTK